jgi:CDP-6-deoxy-D-xylo-4-hexulose-3-dehydrase
MEGGMVTTHSKELAETLHSIRAHGWLRGLPKENSVHPLSEDPWEDLFKFVLPGFNLRPLELSGAVGQEQLHKFPNFLQKRRENAGHFKSLFKGSEHFLTQIENGHSSWFGFSLVLKEHLKGRRKDFVDLLGSLGVETRPIVAGNFVRNPVMKHLNHSALGSFENADYIHDNGFFIGNHHFDVKDELSKVFSTVTSLAEEMN